MENQLADFIRSRREKSGRPKIDWQARKNEWISSVEQLYVFVEELLRDAIDTNDVTIQTIDFGISEQFVGQYHIPALELNIGGELVEFRPQGISIIGAAGRVDIRGEMGIVTLLFKSEAAIGSEWSVLLQRVPMRIIPLDQDSLKDALERVMLP